LTTKFENIQVFSNNIINDPIPLTILASPKIIGLGDFIFKIIDPSAHKAWGGGGVVFIIYLGLLSFSSDILGTHWELEGNMLGTKENWG
jgi:hypothetical protein